MYLGEGNNEYGTPISKFQCDTCGGKYTVCPSVAMKNLDDWQNCMALTCASYDPERDADKFFEPDSNVQVMREPVQAMKPQNFGCTEGR